MFLEAKAGPYEAVTDKDWAPWAPEEGGAGAQTYLEEMRRYFRV